MTSELAGRHAMIQIVLVGIPSLTIKDGIKLSKALTGNGSATAAVRYQ